MSTTAAPSYTPRPEYPHALSAWLTEATRGLCEEAAARVTREVVEHFDASVCARLEQGAPRSEAEAAALAALGSAGVARRRLRKANLTKNDVMLLASITGTPVEGLRGPRASSFVTAFLLAVLLGWTTILSCMTTSHLYDIGTWCMTLSICAMLAVPTLGALFYANAPERGPKGALHRVFRIQCLIVLVIALLALVQIATVPASAAVDWLDFVNLYFGPPTYAVMALYSALYGSLRISRKLHHDSKPVSP